MRTSGMTPWLIRCAFTMIWLLAAWRNTSVKRTTGSTPLAIMSASTWPGPTEGNWSTSPTTSRAAVFGTALSSACISSTSTMDVSSTMSRSQSRGFSPSRRNPPVLGSTSSSRWMVLASKPVASFMRLAARPVGAHSKSLAPLAERMRRMALTRVVLPTPRPAGDHQHLGRQCQRHGRPLASGEYQTRPLLDPGDRLVRINPGPWQRAGPQLQQPLGDAPLRPVQAGQENAGLIADRIGNHRAVSQFEVKGACGSSTPEGPREAFRPAARGAEPWRPSIQATPEHHARRAFSGPTRILGVLYRESFFFRRRDDS